MIDSGKKSAGTVGCSEQSNSPSPSDGGQRFSADQLSFREATRDDAAVIADIYNESIRAGGACMEEDPYSPTAMRHKIAGLNSREVILVLESDQPLAGIAPPGERVLGWGIIKRYSDRQGYRFTCETAVYLRRQLVGGGLGTRIKGRQIEWARAHGYHHMVAKILSINKASIEYNKRFGYEVVGVQKEIGFQDGKWQDITILQLVLDTQAPQLDTPPPRHEPEP